MFYFWHLKIQMALKFQMEKMSKKSKFYSKTEKICYRI